MVRLNPRKRFKAALRSRSLTLVLLIIAGAVSLAVGREVARRVSVQREVNRLTQDITAAQRSTDDLSRLIATLRSVTYQEGAARTQLNLQKPGERVVVIPDDQDDVQSAPVEQRGPTAPVAPEPNARRWWNFLFGSDSSSSS